MKKIYALLLAGIMLALSFAFSLFAAADPSAKIEAYNLINADNVYIAYMVSFENLTRKTDEKGVLIWTAPQSDYTYSTAEYKLSESAGALDGKSVYEFRELTAKQMTDDIYSMPYVKAGNNIYYGRLTKYSILQYAYNKLGKTGTAAADTALTNLLTAMLDYGASAQKLFDYKADRPANEKFYLIRVEGGVLADGTTGGYYQEGEKVEMVSSSGRAGTVWVNEKGETRATGARAEITVRGQNETITAK